MAKRKTNGTGRMPIYKSYTFRDKDPIIDELRTLVEDHYGVRVNGKSLRQITEAGGPTASCMGSWFFGTTKRPQNATIEAAGRAMGYRRVWQREKGK
jgi:hypothetical protein